MAFYTPLPDGLRLRVRIAPKAARAGLNGVMAAADGQGHLLKVSVTEPPDKGQANAALQKMLAKRWKIGKTAVSIVAGETDRIKTLHLAGNPTDLAAVAEAIEKELS